MQVCKERLLSRCGRGLSDGFCYNIAARADTGAATFAQLKTVSVITKLNGLDPLAHFVDILGRIHDRKLCRLGEWLPKNSSPGGNRNGQSSRIINAGLRPMRLSLNCAIVPLLNHVLNIGKRKKVFDGQYRQTT